MCEVSMMVFRWFCVLMVLNIAMLSVKANADQHGIHESIAPGYSDRNEPRDQSKAFKQALIGKVAGWLSDQTGLDSARLFYRSDDRAATSFGEVFTKASYGIDLDKSRYALTMNVRF